MPRPKKAASKSAMPPGGKSSSKPVDRAAAKVAEKVATAFTEAQRTSASHPRASKLLQSAFEAAPTHFVTSFTHAINRILLVFSRDANIERLVLFVAKFASQAHDSGDFCSLVLMYLLHHTNANGRAIRFRTMQLVAAVLHHLPEDTELADEVWVPLGEAALDRSYDRVPRVRAAAAGALCRLQTGAEDDPFGARLVAMLTSDSGAAVRKAALQAVAITDYTLAAVAGRTRDVNVEVRKAAYETLAGKVNPFDLHTSERIALLARGLRDRVPGVREVVETRLLLDGWFDGACEGNVFELVDLLGCEEYEEDVLRALGVVFRSQKFEELMKAVEIDVNNLTHADVLLLRALSNAKKADEAIEKYLPSALLYADVLRYYAVNDFASRHLLELCTSVDISDEAGRKAVEDVIREDFLVSTNISEESVKSAVRAMRRVVMEEESTCRLIHDILKDVLRTDECSGGDEPTAEEKNWQEQRALNICLEMLRIARQGATTGSAVNAICLNLVELAVLPQLMSEHEDRRRTALECLGLFCLLDKSGAEAETKMPLFIQAAKTDLPSIQELALKALVDFLMVFDLTAKTGETTQSRSGSLSSPECDEDPSETLQDPDVSEKSSNFSSVAEECINVLSKNITSADGMMRTIAVEGLARLLFVRRIAPNGTLLSRLLIVHHNPSTEDDDKLRQCLSVFFPAFAMSSSQNRLGLEDAFLPTCRIISSAPSKSPLSTISLVQVGQFVLHLTNPANAPLKKEKSTTEIVGRSASLIHERLAEVVLNEIIDVIEMDEIRLCREYSRILSNFRFSWSADNNEKLELLQKLAKAAMQETEDKRLKTTLEKFSKKIQKLLKDNEVALKALREETEDANDSEKEVPHENETLTAEETGGRQLDEEPDQEAGTGQNETPETHQEHSEGSAGYGEDDDTETIADPNDSEGNAKIQKLLKDNEVTLKALREETEDANDSEKEVPHENETLTAEETGGRQLDDEPDQEAGTDQNETPETHQENSEGSAGYGEDDDTETIADPNDNEGNAENEENSNDMNVESIDNLDYEKRAKRKYPSRSRRRVRHSENLDDE